jgi:hypothetical protein
MAIPPSKTSWSINGQLEYQDLTKNSQIAQLTSENPIRKVDHSGLFDDFSHFSNKGLMGWVRLHVVVSIFCRVENSDESMGKSVLESTRSVSMHRR